MDINGDGEISFDEFEAMMKLLINKSNETNVEEKQ